MTERMDSSESHTIAIHFAQNLVERWRGRYLSDLETLSQGGVRSRSSVLRWLRQRVEWLLIRMSCGERAEQWWMLQYGARQHLLHS